MPRKKRSDVIDESAVGIYHITMRCVRQAFLCGYDEIREKDVSHRRGMIRDRLAFLAEIFMIDVVGYGEGAGWSASGVSFDPLGEPRELGWEARHLGDRHQLT